MTRPCRTAAAALVAGALVVAGCASARPPRPAIKSASSGRVAPSVESQDKALAAALLRLAAHPSADAQKAVALEYRRLGMLEQAFTCFSEAAHLDPRDGEAYEGLARIWRDWGFPQRGLADAARSVYYAPQSASAHNTRGTLLAATGSFDAARQEFERALSLDDRAAYAQTNVCYVEMAEGHAKGAIDECRRAVERDPESAVAHNNLALSLAADGQFDAAEREFLVSGDPMAARYNLGLAYLAAGRLAEAHAAFASVSPRSAVGRRAHARAQQTRVPPDEATDTGGSNHQY